MNGQQQQGFTVPVDAFKEATCLCGADVFHTGYRYKFYQGILSQGQLCIMEEKVYKCDHCGTVYGANGLFINK